MINIQESFLNHMRKNKTPVIIFLVNGVRMEGNVVCFDKETIVLDQDGVNKVIYKSVTSTLIPYASSNGFDYAKFCKQRPGLVNKIKSWATRS